MAWFSENNLQQSKFRLIERRKIRPVQLDPRTRVFFASRRYALVQTDVLSPFACQLISLLFPPIVIRSEGGYCVVANVRTVELCSHLPEDFIIGAIVLPRTEIDLDALRRQVDLLSLMLEGLSLRYARGPFLELWKQLPAEVVQTLSSDLSSRSALERILGVCRKQPIKDSSEAQLSIWS